MLLLETFGGLKLTDEHGERLQPRRRIALFARLAVSGARGVSRDELLALFWPERDIESARHSLGQLLYEARVDLGAPVTRGTATLRLDADAISSDVADWESALERHDLAAAAAVYRGPFLHGFYLSGLAEFERWVETARGKLAADHRAVLEKLATRAATNGQVGDAVVWWRRLAAEDRFGARTALGLMRALVDAGDRGGALEFARVHERIMRAELESAPDPAVSAFVDTLRSQTPRPAIAQAPNPVTRDSAPPASALAPIAGAVAGDSSPDSGSPAIAGTLRHGVIVRTRTRAMVIALASLALIAGYAMTRGRAGNSGAATDSIAARVSMRAPVGAMRVGNLKHETTNIAAHDLFERGRDPLLLRSDSGQRAAIDFLRRAIALDTNYARAYALLANRYTSLSWSARISLAERRATLARAEAAARRAVALDDSLADAHTALGYILAVAYDEPGSLAELERATALDPNAGESLEMLSKAYEWMGRPADAVATARRAVRIDSLSVTANAELGDAFYFAHRYDEAIAQLAKLSAVEPPLRRRAGFLAAVYGATGRWPDAIALLRASTVREPFHRGLLGYALARSGRRAEATRILTQMLGDESAGLAPAEAIAEVYWGLGERERAFVWLERAFDDHSLNPEIMGPMFDDLRADPRFEHVRQRLGIPGPIARTTTSMR